MQFCSDRLGFDDIRLFAVDERRGKLVGELAGTHPQPLVDPVGRSVGIGEVGGIEELLETVGIERIALQPIAGEEERRQRLERKLIGVVFVLVGKVDAFVVLDIIEDRVDELLVVGADEQDLVLPAERQARGRRDAR